MYFQKNKRGNYVGYHHQGGENYIESGRISLSLEALENHRPLFMGNAHRTEWNAAELEPEGTLFEIEFLGDLKVWHTADLEEYWDLTLFNRKHHTYGDRLLGLIDEGYSVFSVDPYLESKEGFLVNPRDNVIALQPFLMADQVYRKI